MPKTKQTNVGRDQSPAVKKYRVFQQKENEIEKEGEKRRERECVSSNFRIHSTYIEFGHRNIYQAAQDNEEIKTVPRVPEVVLGKADKRAHYFQAVHCAVHNVME